jgi:multiple sugar transport system substrate-binding protein
MKGKKISRITCSIFIIQMVMLVSLVIPVLAQDKPQEPLQFYGWDFKPEKIEEFIKLYQDEYNENVEVHITPNIGYLPAMQSKIMGGARIDVMYNFRWNQQRWFDLGWAADMSDKPGIEEILNDIIDSAKPSYISPDGKVVSLPYFLAAYVNMYNPKLLKEAGINAFPQTKEALYSACQALKEKGICDGPYVAFWNKDFVDRYFFIYLISEGIQVFNDEYIPVFQDNPETEKVMEWWVKLYQDGLTSPTILTDTPTDLVVAMQEGKAAFFNLHHYFLKGIREAGAKESENVILAPREPGKTGTTLPEGEVLQLGGNTPDPDRAWQLIKFYSWKDKDGNYTVPKAWGLEAGLLEPYKGFLADSEIVDNFKKWIDWDMLMNILNNQSSPEPVRSQTWYSEWRSEAADILHSMLLKETSVAEAIQQLTDAANQKREEAQ